MSSKFMSAVRRAVQFISLSKHRAGADGIESRITEAIIKRGKDGRSIAKNIDAILVQFPKIDKALRLIKKEFVSLDGDMNEALDLEEIRVCLRRLKVEVSEEEVKSLFRETDMDHDGLLQFKEFILFVTFVYLMEPSQTQAEGSTPAKCRLTQPEVEKAFEIMVDAFLMFDTDLDGVLVKKEVTGRFGSSEGGKTGGSFAKGRFAEMDYDQNGRCTFKEFCFAFVGWVGTADEDDE